MKLSLPVWCFEVPPLLALVAIMLRTEVAPPALAHRVERGRS